MKIGILGGGQLARMLALAAYPLGMQTLCFESANNTCAAAVTAIYQAEYADETQLRAFAEQVDVITFESENIPLAAATFLNQLKPLYPSLAALQTSQDRYLEKNFFTELDIPTPRFVAVDSLKQLHTAVAELGLPAVLKTRRCGYDGKGQVVLRTPADLAPAWHALQNTALILEQFVLFERELSLITVRSRTGALQFYPLIQNQHQEGILRLSSVPIKDAALQTCAESYATSILTKLNYVGVCVLELFQVGQQLLANEMAPRVHNSGHWTIEGASVSQFEHHLRAIGDLPLNEIEINAHNAMFNLLGTEPAMASVLQIPGTHYHTYGKTPRPGRKLGHVTLTCASALTYQQGLKRLNALLWADKTS